MTDLPSECAHCGARREPSQMALHQRSAPCKVAQLKAELASLGFEVLGRKPAKRLAWRAAQFETAFGKAVFGMKPLLLQWWVLPETAPIFSHVAVAYDDATTRGAAWNLLAAAREAAKSVSSC